ncbi:MAG: phosphoglucosamine mutase [Acidimicrobiales bacterium]
MTLRFGTDGVRGVAGLELSPEYALALGRAAARVLGARRFVVGRDTRLSGPMLEAALCAGLAAEGVEAVRLGVCPTPTVAWAAAAEPGVAGAVISASHNPFSDNGIKLFALGGLKLGDAGQHAIEAVLAEPALGSAAAPGNGEAVVGRIVEDRTALAGYGAALIASLEGRRLDGVRAVIDCANGAAFELAPRLLAELGVELQVIADRPDGRNINDGCGSTALGGLAEAVRSSGAALGLAFDGDADRVLAVDAAGELIDGDQLIGMCALDRRRRGALPDATVVVTVMANLGFRLGMERHCITVRETAVGDRYVLEELERGGWALGGEQSGHVIFRDLATTGDGLLTAVQVLDLVHRRGATIRELADEAMTRLPQVLRNVRVERADPAALEAVAAQVSVVEARLGGQGRVLIRPSGTEPLVRVMVEAADAADAEAAAEELAAALERRLRVSQGR